MASINLDEANTETPHVVVTNTGGSMEFDRALRADAPIGSERLTIVGADTATQIAWLDAIEAALGEVQEHLQGRVLADARTTTSQLRAEITSPQPRSDMTRKLWLLLYASISTPFLAYYSSAVGNDLGHATAHKIIEVLSHLSHYLKP